MAELAVSMVVGPLVSLVKDKMSNYLLDQYNVMEGMEKQQKTLKRKLPAILDIMADAEKQASHREGVKAWLEELKTVAYEANDIFDEFQYEALRRKAKKEGHITKLGIMAGVKLLLSHNRVAFRNRMGNKLSAIVETIEVLVAEMNAFGFKHQLEAPPAWKEWRETDHNINDPENIVSGSRDQERKKIVEILFEGKACSDGDLMVVPIVGMGGLGKTTLAQLIYNDPRVQEHFQLLKWVCVSDDFNVRNLANKICNSSETSLEKVLNKLQDELKGKRYLLVLDDIWNKDVDKWQKLKVSLKHGGVGSAILLTTRDKEIAEFMGTIVDNSWKNNKYHDVAVLDNRFIQEIIESRAGLSNLPEGKCAGSPLAAKALGSVLRNKTTKQEWEDVSRQSIICSDETGILPVLKLSYDELPSNMRQCFAFCALYPKDYEIDAKNLIQLWMANGYISDEKKILAETVGEQIIREMVSRSFFQYVDQDPTRFGYSSTTLLKIHDLMHDVALSASGKECIYITDENITDENITDEMSQSNELLPSAVRHIQYPESLNQGLAILFDSLRRMSTPIQTLAIGGIYDRHVQQSSKYSSVRALALLSLEGHGHSAIKPKHLHHLRYLDLSNSEMEALPDDISILYNLQTLKLSGCWRLRRLPKQMKYMTALRHPLYHSLVAITPCSSSLSVAIKLSRPTRLLSDANLVLWYSDLYTDGCGKLMGMPPEFGRLTSLQTVTCFLVGSGKDSSGLGELKHLNIGGSLENVGKATSAKSANLGEKEELRQLSLWWSRGKEQEEKQCQDEVLEALKAHDKLMALTISSYQGNLFPSWMGALRNMLPPFCQLPELQLLRLEGLGKLQSLCSRCAPSMFGKLKDLKLVSLDAFDSFFCEAGQGEVVVAFPQLEVLYIQGCKSLKALPEGAVVVLSETHGDGDNNAMTRSAFPRLKRLTLVDLRSFERWEAADAALEIKAEQPWEAVDGLEVVKVEQRWMVVFPLLETVRIDSCPQLTTLPRALKLGELNVRHAKEDMPTLELSDVVVNVDDGKEEERSCWDHHMSSVTVMHLHLSDVFFLGSRALLALWACFGQLQDLTIGYCHQLVYWPEKEFEGLASMRTLRMVKCNSLVGYAAHAAATDGQATTSSEEEERRSLQLLPRLESLEIQGCGSLVEVLNAPAALKRMGIARCGKLESLSFLPPGMQQDKTPSSSLKHHHHQGGGSSSTDDVTAASTAAAAAVHEEEELSLPAAASTTSNHQDKTPLVSADSTPNKKLRELPLLKSHGGDTSLELYFCGAGTSPLKRARSNLLPFPSSSSLLESLQIYHCLGLSEVLSLPPSLREISIGDCSNLRLLSACQMRALKKISIFKCPELRSLESILIPAAAAASLESLRLFDCKSLASLPPSEPHQGYYYSSLRWLTIGRCPAIKSLPPALQQRLDSLEEKDLDARLEAGTTHQTQSRSLVAV
ncbi:hypothetical protein U9M48_000215 [Paspalum notatum var. saurae]|uniref:Uncharacterized protein n=1 Tax=Paspalum notatum var. saurae TaxID=547442 RepID=A0AAQ3PJY2_PASNO